MLADGGVFISLLQKLYLPSWLYRGGTLGTEWENRGLLQKSAADSSAPPEVLRAVGRQNEYDDVMGKTILICTISFVLGARATAAPFLIAGTLLTSMKLPEANPRWGQASLRSWVCLLRQ